MMNYGYDGLSALGESQTVKKYGGCENVAALVEGCLEDAQSHPECRMFTSTGVICKLARECGDGCPTTSKEECVACFESSAGGIPVWAWVAGGAVALTGIYFVFFKKKAS